MAAHLRARSVRPCQSSKAVPAMGVCARAIQAGSGTGTWGQYSFEVDRDGHVHVNRGYVGVMRRADLPARDPGRR